MTRRDVKKSRKWQFLCVWRAKMALNLIKSEQNFVCVLKTCWCLCVKSLIVWKGFVQTQWALTLKPAVWKTSKNRKILIYLCIWLSEKVEKRAHKSQKTKANELSILQWQTMDFSIFFPTIMCRKFEKMKKKLKNYAPQVFRFCYYRPWRR